MQIVCEIILLISLERTLLNSHSIISDIDLTTCLPKVEHPHHMPYAPYDVDSIKVQQRFPNTSLQAVLLKASITAEVSDGLLL